ncbi:HNH endonuclease [Brachyspira pilosicoli]|uniref:HNH endonuclease n=1 Tax=Brachyspira pilosicoli TaxID=52584 RepID=UPI00255CC362|nr:HNH endonuclease [Brachyspira pilosicoli]
MVCIYCGNNTMSEEHIIPNALGGKYKSSKICCKKCNNGVLSEIDAKFCDIFSYIVYSIPNLKKERNNSNKHSYTAYAYSKKYDDVYQVNMKSGNITSCEELSKLYHSNFNLKEFKKESLIFSVDFKLDNDDFKNGLFKIAFQYAIEKGVDLKYLKKNVKILETNKGNITKMKFDYKYKIIPFIPLNIFDVYLEDIVELSHTLILFNEKNILCCYIDLFNTFQYYVILSDIYNGTNIYEDYYEVLNEENYSQKRFGGFIKELEDYKLVSSYSNSYDIGKNLSYEETKNKILEEYSYNMKNKKDYYHSIEFYFDRKLRKSNSKYLELIEKYYLTNNNFRKSNFNDSYIKILKTCQDSKTYTYNKYYNLIYYLNDINNRIIDENSMKYYMSKLIEKYPHLRI